MKVSLIDTNTAPLYIMKL